MSACLSVRKGSIYIPSSDCETFFRGLDAVIVVVRENELNVMPVQQMSAGGYILKIRNANGDRVVTAPDVFAEHQLMDWNDDAVEAVWCSERGALICALPKV